MVDPPLCDGPGRGNIDDPPEVEIDHKDASLGRSHDICGCSVVDASTTTLREKLLQGFPWGACALVPTRKSAI